MGQNFSWIKQICQEFEQQRAGNLRNAVRRICVKIECRWFCKPIKGQSKPQRRDPASSSTRTIPIGEKTWTDVQPGKYSLNDYPVSKKLIHLLRHGSLPRDNDGAIEFWRIKDHLQNHFLYCHHWSDCKLKSSMAGGGGHRKRFQYCADSSGTILYLRALQGHSGRNLIDPTLQDNVVIPNNFFKYIYHARCAINLHSIINSGLIPGGQNVSNRQTVFFLPVDPMDKEHKDPDTIDLGTPRLARYMHKAWKKHQNTVYWVDINLAQKKGLKFYQTRSNAIILHEPLPAYCIPKAIMMETGEIIYEKVYASPRPPPKISLKHDWMKELQPDTSQTRFSRDSKNFNLGEESNHDRMGRPVVCSRSERSMLNEVDIDFRIPGLPHSVVKQAENYRVRELVKQIENHPHRQALQHDLQQNNAHNPFSEKSRKMIKDMGNVELFELFETDPKTQCKECLLYLSQGIVYCACGHLLRENESSRHLHQWRLDVLSIPNYVIKKGRTHGHRFGKTKEQRDYHIAHNYRKRCIKRHFEGIHDRLLKDPEFRESQLENDRTEEVCIQMNEIAQKDFSYHMTQAEYFRYRKNWWISLNNSGRSAMRSFWLQRCVVHIKPSTPRIWRTTTQASAILEVSKMTPIIEFFFQLVAMERFLVELMIIKRKSTFAVWISTRNSRTGQKVNKFGALTTSELGTQSDKPNNMLNDFEACENSRVHQPMTRGRCGLNHSLACLFLQSLFHVVSVSVPWLFSLFTWSHTAWLKGPQGSRSHSSHVVICCECCSWISSTSPFTSSPSWSSLWSPCCSCCPTPSSSTMWWTDTLRTSAEDLGTGAENEPPTWRILLSSWADTTAVQTEPSSSKTILKMSMDNGLLTKWLVSKAKIDDGKIVFLDMGRQQASLAVQSVHKSRSWREEMAKEKVDSKELVEDTLVKNKLKTLNGGRKKIVLGGPRVKKARKFLRKVTKALRKVVFAPTNQKKE